MFSWASIKVRLVTAGAVVLAVLAAIGLALRGARRDGINHVLVEQQGKRDELQKHYDEIDSRPIDVDNAYAGLKHLSDDRDGG